MSNTETFAAIDVGSFDLAMKIYDMSPKKGVKELDSVVHALDIGSDTYAEGLISTRHIHEMTDILNDYATIMRSYKVTSYRAVGTSALRETRDINIVLQMLRERTGINIEVISNSEQRFINYKAIAARGDMFSRVLEETSAIADIGGGSIQISVFENDKLIATQNMRLGILRLRDILEKMNTPLELYGERIAEIAHAHIANIKKMIVKNRKIENLIIIDDHVSPVMRNILANGADNLIERERFEDFLRDADRKPQLTVSRQLQIALEDIGTVRITGLLMDCIGRELGVKKMWAPGVTLADGIAYDYAMSRGYIRPEHDFEQDIIACAQSTAKRYMSSRKRSETLYKIASNIYDAMKKIHGLTKREKLLLQISTILHDCGKYISLMSMGESSYHIIMSTEIIGLSHREREIVANIVRFNHTPFETLTENPVHYANLDKEAYLTIVKLTAILRVANGLDRAHKQKFKDVGVKLKDNELILSVDDSIDVAVEKGMFSNRARFFEEVYGIIPVIRQKRV